MVEEVMATEPFASVQVGCVTVTVGAAGADGCAFIVPVVAAETQPLAFSAVIL
jgi:hypothetical protein